jgi:hypothetical protein
MGSPVPELMSAFVADARGLASESVSAGLTRENPFESWAPNIARWVKEFGRIEIGSDLPADTVNQALANGLE